MLDRPLIFVGGKGGVGKSTLSHALALALARKGKRVLAIEFENPTIPNGKQDSPHPNAEFLNLDPETAFHEYVAMKVKIPFIAKMFSQNKLIEFLAKAAPGIRELVLLGKAWHERKNYDHVIIDLPATGHGLTLFQSTKNYSLLFRGGPIQRDTDAMLATFRNPDESRFIVLAIPEETPLREGKELGELYKNLFPDNHALFFLNQSYPQIPAEFSKMDETSPQAYLARKQELQKENLELWNEIKYEEIPYFFDHSPIEKTTAVIEEQKWLS